MLKIFTSSITTASTETPLVSAQTTGYVTVLSNIDLCTPTAATVTFKLYNNSATEVGRQVFTTSADNETVSLDTIKIIPEGYYMNVMSTSTDTLVAAYGSYSLNNAV